MLVVTGTRDDLAKDLSRYARRHGWNVIPIRLGYYSVRFVRGFDVIAARIGPGDRITEVTVDIGRDHYQLSLPARSRLEELLATPELEQ